MRSNYLTRKHFFQALAIAVVVHVAGGVVLAVNPPEKVTKIPVHVLNVKLGAGDSVAVAEASRQAIAAEQAKAKAAASDPKPVPPPFQHERMEAAKPQTTKNKEALPQPKSPAKAQQEKTAPTIQAMKKINAPSGAVIANADSFAASHAPTQYVRSAGDIAGMGIGSPLGNSLETEAEVMKRYEQLISIWIQKHKVYPDELRNQGMHGRALIRIRINRAGRIQYFKLDRPTDYPKLNDAVTTMVRASDPLPAVPSNYPAGNLIEFIIPVNYKL